MTDWWLGNLIDRLHELNLERETVIALVADHGISLGEHGWTGKVQTALYPVLTRVPLILVHPEHRRAGQASDWFASTHDLAPTLLSMAGVRPPRAHDRRGPLARRSAAGSCPSATTPGAATRTRSSSAPATGCSGATTGPATSSCSTSAATRA